MCAAGELKQSGGERGLARGRAVFHRAGEREREKRRLLLIRGGGSSPRSVRLLSDTCSHSHIFMSLRNPSPVIEVTGIVSQG
ncbi:hypothetical protein QQF64_012600 [Cirrhinus molitorella]|uniref:Uncharacterized protein n=1 Tax=Cirrhinus molitorella TaxID=172907 RepID=A0ABR3LX10_9TELE